jgi:hypothetical protein
MTIAKINPAQQNSETLEREIDWFSRVLDVAMQQYFEESSHYADVKEITPPDIKGDQSEYALLITQYAINFDERLILILTLLPHIRPQLLDLLFIRNKNLDRGYAEFGGWQGKYHGGFLPTGETAVFILAGQDLVRRFEVIQCFESEHFFSTAAILRIERHSADEPFLSGALMVMADSLSRCTSGIKHKPDFSMNFPAKLITTKLNWNDLILAPQVMDEIDVLRTWMQHSHTIMKDWGMEKSIKPGYRCLFYGPPGTGKTLTASLLGAELNVDVYRIDLSMVVSKYIGETEKNLANVFDQAESKNWILFFDEADALFGKRTQTSSSNDRHANQEVSYLLQRVEDYPGVVILATNLKANIDDAFARRFQSLVYFPLPDASLRKRLWETTLNGRTGKTDDVDLAHLSSKYELTGGAIINVVRNAAISALQMKRNSINQDDLIKGVTKELRKEGKTI